MGIKHTFVSGHADPTDASLVRPSNWNDNHTVDSEFEIPYVASPAVPSATGVNLFTEKIANSYRLAQRGPVSPAVPLQPWMARRHIVCWQAVGHNTHTGNGLGYANQISGTATARGVSYTYFGQIRRAGAVSAAGAGSACGHRSGSGGLLLGNGSGLGGFLVVMTFGCSDAATVSGARQFVGVCNNSSALTDQDPAAMLRCIGVGHNQTDANLQFFANTASTPQKVDLGANFPKNTLSADWYELALFSPADEAEKVYYQLTRKNTGHTASGVSQQMSGFVSGGTAVLPNSFRSNGATALAVGLDMGLMYEESIAA